LRSICNQIRHALSCELGKLEGTAEIAGSLRALRAACRKFLDAMPSTDRGRPMRSHHDDRDFLTALGELRGVFGVHRLARFAGAVRSALMEL